MTPVVEPIPSFAGYSRVFEATTSDGKVRIVIAPWGDVIAFGGKSAVLLARDTGRELLSFDTCYFPDATQGAAFIDDHHLLVACIDRVDEVTFPDGRVSTLFKHRYARTTAIGGGRIVIAGGVNLDPYDVTVYSVEGLRVVDKFVPQEGVGTLVLSADGTKVAAETRTQVIVRDLIAKTSRTLPVDDRHQLLAFSPDGHRLLMRVGASESAEIDLATGTTARVYAAGPDVHEARYLGEGKLLVTGNRRLVLFSGAREGTPATQKDLGGGALDVSSDGSFFCNTETPDSDKIACFSNKPVAASTFVPKAPPPAVVAAAPPGEPPSAPEAHDVEAEGTLVSRAGRVVTVTLADATGFTVGAKGALYKSFETKLGALAVSGWMSIADVEVRAVSDHKVVLTITKETADVMMNGTRQDQLAPKTRIQVKLTR